MRNRLVTPVTTIEEAAAFLVRNAWPEKWQDFTEAQKMNLCDYMRTDRFVGSDGIQNGVLENATTFDAEFEKICAEYPAWKSRDSFVFWLEFQDTANLKVIRRQMNGLCYMHAPTVLQHYLVTLNGGGGEMLDIGSFVKSHLVGNALRNHILRDEGGSSIDFLKTIAKLGNEDVLSYKIPLSCDPVMHSATAVAIASKLRTLQRPALVSAFQVDAKFFRGGLSFLEMHSESTHIGSHAMLLVAWRVISISFSCKTGGMEGISLKCHLSIWRLLVLRFLLF